MIVGRLTGSRSRKLRFGDFEPDTYRLITSLTIDQCSDRLGEVAPDLPWHSSLFGTTEQLRTWQGKGHPVIGDVDDVGFDLEQKVLMSPLGRKRIARGNFERMHNGTLIVYQLHHTSVPQAADIWVLTSIRWKRFDRDEAALFLDFICGALHAELVSEEIVEQLRQSRGADNQIALPAATPVDDFLAALDAIIQDSDDATL